MKLTYRCLPFVVHCPSSALLMVANKTGGEGGNMVHGDKTSDGGVKMSPTTIKRCLGSLYALFVVWWGQWRGTEGVMV